MAFYGEIFSSSDPQETAITRIDFSSKLFLCWRWSVEPSDAQLLCYSKWRQKSSSCHTERRKSKRVKQGGFPYDSVSLPGSWGCQYQRRLKLLSLTYNYYCHLQSKFTRLWFTGLVKILKWGFQCHRQPSLSTQFSFQFLWNCRHILTWYIHI